VVLFPKKDDAYVSKEIFRHCSGRGVPLEISYNKIQSVLHDVEKAKHNK
jgi:hypothetical protein